MRFLPPASSIHKFVEAMGYGPCVVRVPVNTDEIIIQFMDRRLTLSGEEVAAHNWRYTIAAKVGTLFKPAAVAPTHNEWGEVSP